MANPQPALANLTGPEQLDGDSGPWAGDVFAGSLLGRYGALVRDLGRVNFRLNETAGLESTFPRMSKLHDAQVQAIRALANDPKLTKERKAELIQSIKDFPPQKVRVIIGAQ